jgi:molybdenum cofactor cytidylyltransferase
MIRPTKPPMNDLDCVMLAAGSSSRMSSWKMTLPLGASTLAERSVATALEVCSRVVLVGGFRAAELGERFRGQPRVTVVVNRDYERGMLSSVQTGCREVGSARFFLALADMPLVSADTYRCLLRCATVEHPGVPVVVPHYGGKKGHPLLLVAAMAQRILDAPPGQTLREVLRAVPTLVVPVEDRHVLQDVDTPEDYQALLGAAPAEPG